MGNLNYKVYTQARKIFMLLPESIIRMYERNIEKRIFKKYYNIKVNKSKFKETNQKSKIMVCVIDEKVNSGGLSDRINGIISTYKIAKKINIDFKILHSKPFSLDRFLVPNSYDWRININQLKFISGLSIPIFIRSLHPPKIEKREKSFMRAIHSQYKISQFHCFTNIRIFSDNEFSSLFNELFKPSDVLQKAIDIQLKNIGEEYISITFRFQQLLGDFKEGNSPILHEEDRKILIEKGIKVIEELHNTHKKEKILVTSDSTTFLAEASKKQFVYTIPGKIVHIAYEESASETIYLKSFIDLYMIANASKIYSAIIGKMFDSGFPKLASLIYGRSFEKIIRN